MHSHRFIVHWAGNIQLRVQKACISPMSKTVTQAHAFGQASLLTLEVAGKACYRLSSCHHDVDSANRAGGQQSQVGLS